MNDEVKKVRDDQQLSGKSDGLTPAELLIREAQAKKLNRNATTVLKESRQQKSHKDDLNALKVKINRSNTSL
jgi:hypothetical protein